MRSTMYLSLLLFATEFITILMKFPRDKQQKKVEKMGQDEEKGRRERDSERRRPAVSAFISIHILFVVFILSNP